MARLRQIAGSETGFTLVELMVVLALTGVLLTLGAYAVRQFWLVRSVTGAQDTIVTQLRQVQQRSFSESHPNVYGLAVKHDHSDFAVVKGNATDNSCTVVNRQLLGDGIDFTTASNLGTVSTMTTNCRTQLGGTGTWVMVFFYPRGSSSVGLNANERKIVLTQPAIDRSASIEVSRLTGRVSRL